jgi:hypothetical protein
LLDANAKNKLPRFLGVGSWGFVMHWIVAAILLFASSTATMASDYYKVQVTRKGQDLYEVVGQGGLYVKTRYCYEYVYFADAILKIDSPVGFNIGEIIFVGSGSNKCDVEKLL